jgi:hypothetical protein
MNVLAIGNSFSQDATRYLHQIAACGGAELTVVNLYIGGCSLERHWQNARQDLAEYAVEINGEATGRLVSLKEMLRQDTWDIVTLQQVSQLSVDYRTYQPYLTDLSAMVRQLAPSARQMIHQTWAYEQGSDRLMIELGYQDQSDMHRDLCLAYAQAARDLGGLTIIPSGASFQAAIRQGLTPLHRDTFHASLGLGRCLLGLTWYTALTGSEPGDLSALVFDEPIAPDLLSRLKTCVVKAG